MDAGLTTFSHAQLSEFLDVLALCGPHNEELWHAVRSVRNQMHRRIYGQPGAATTDGIAGREGAVDEVGPLSQRKTMGNRPRGLQRERGCLELLPARPVAFARVPLGRGRSGGNLRRSPSALLCPGSLEREGPDSQGADVRPDQQRGKSRGGRERILLLSRQHAHPFVHEISLQVSARGLSLRGPGGDQPRPVPAGEGVRAPRHGDIQQRPIFRCFRGVRQGGS